jgi:hypothetical protein
MEQPSTVTVPMRIAAPSLTDHVEVDRTVVVEAADLWEQAADGLGTG